MRRGADTPSNIIVQFISTFGVWLLADRLGLSGVLTIVSYAITIARQAPASTPARLRVPSYAVWETTVFVLNVLAFVLIGLQIGPIVENLKPEQLIAYLGIAAAVLVTVILVRIAWVMSYNAVARWHVRRFGFHPVRPMIAPTVKGGIVVSALFLIGVFGMFEWALTQGASAEKARTLAVNTLVVMEVLYLFSVRFLRTPSLTLQGILGTRPVLISVSVVVALQLLFTYAPIMERFFQTRPIGIVEGIPVIAAGIAVFAILEVEKLVQRHLDADWKGTRRAISLSLRG